MERKMSSVDGALSKALQKQRQRGALDIKCHVEVTNSTRQQDLKRALTDVLERDAKGAVPAVPLRDLNSFSDLMKHII